MHFRKLFAVTSNNKTVRNFMIPLHLTSNHTFFATNSLPAAGHIKYVFGQPENFHVSKLAILTTVIDAALFRASSIFEGRRLQVEFCLAVIVVSCEYFP